MELAVSSTHAATDCGSATLRPRRSKAGNRLSTILEAVREESEDDEETIPTRAHLLDLNDRQRSDNSRDAEPACCVCAREVTKDTQPFLTCSQDKCQAVVHISCTSYTVRGAKRAKFQCPTCKANKLLAGNKKRGAGSKDKPKEAASSCTPHPHSSCLCMNGESCSNCMPVLLASNSKNKEAAAGCSSPSCSCTNGESCNKCMTTLTLPSLVTKDGVQPPDTQLPKAQPNHPLPGGDVLSVEQPPHACVQEIKFVTSAYIQHKWLLWSALLEKRTRPSNSTSCLSKSV